MIRIQSLSGKTWLLILGVLVLLALAYGSWRDPNFWLTVPQRGDRLMAEKQYQAAAEIYSDPWQIGIAQYRNGDFEEAAATFARVPGAIGAFDQGNARVMQEAYAAAISSYDRALGFRPDWKEAEDNRALAVALKKMQDDAQDDSDQQSADSFDPDEIVFDQKGKDQKDIPKDMNDPRMSESELRAIWLRRVQTTPGDFLRSKFAWQAAQSYNADSAESAEQQP